MQPNSKKRGQRAPKAPPGTPYLEARREWNERYGSHIIDARNWRTAAFGVGVALILSAAGNVIQASNEKIAVYYVNTDSNGKTREIWRADQATPGPSKSAPRCKIGFLALARCTWTTGPPSA